MKAATSDVRGLQISSHPTIDPPHSPSHPTPPPPMYIGGWGVEGCKRPAGDAHTRAFCSTDIPCFQPNVKKNDNWRKIHRQTTKKLLRVSFATDGKQFPNCYVSVKNWLLRASVRTPLKCKILCQRYATTWCGRCSTVPRLRTWWASS